MNEQECQHGDWWPMRELSRDEYRIASAVAAKVLALAEVGVSPTHVVVHRTQFLGVSRLATLQIIRAGYIRQDEAALLVMA